jgi:hypothetical protein
VSGENNKGNKDNKWASCLVSFLSMIREIKDIKFKNGDFLIWIVIIIMLLKNFQHLDGLCEQLKKHFLEKEQKMKKLNLLDCCLLALTLGLGLGLASFDAVWTWAYDPCPQEAAVYAPCVSDTCLATCNRVAVYVGNIPIGYDCVGSDDISVGAASGYFSTTTVDGRYETSVGELAPCTVTVEECARVEYPLSNGSYVVICENQGTSIYEAPTYETNSCPLYAFLNALFNQNS